MRGLVLGLPLSLILWDGIIWLLSEYGFDAVAFLMIFCGSLYIAGTIWRDTRRIADDEWQDGDATGYSDAPR